MSRILLYPNMMKVAERLPDHYKQRYLKIVNSSVPSPHMIYEKGNWKRIEGTDKIFPMKYYNIPPKVIHPVESDKALLSGEGIVCGFTKKQDKQPYKVPKFWRPMILEELFHSEILERWMLIIVTPRTLKLIEQCGGFDDYIIKTSDEVLASRLGLHLKREMLTRLAEDAEEEQRNPGVIGSRQRLLEKFQEHIIPKSEASWIGYSLQEAIFRQMKIENESIDRKPKKIAFLKEAAEELRKRKS